MKTLIRREMLKVNEENQWCKAKVEIRETDKGLELSICGEAGGVETEEFVEEQNLESLREYFSERNPDMTEAEIESHARVALSYGEGGGMEVVGDAPNGGLLVLHSCGQIREELAQFFPEMAPYFRWHLNGMRASVDGKAWEFEPLPSEVIAWAKSFGSED